MTIHKKIYISVVLWAVVLISFLFSGVNDYIAHSLIFLSPIVLVATFGFVVKAVRMSPHIFIKKYFLGFVIIISCSVADLAITFIQSPDLANEGNTIIVKMFSLNYALNFIKAYLIFCQVLIVSTMCGFWMLCCQSAPRIVQSLDKGSIWKLIPQIYGGKNATYTDLLFSRLDPFFFNASIGPLFIGLCMLKIYICLEWLRIIPISDVSRICVAVGIWLLSTVVYCLCLKHYICKKAPLDSAHIGGSFGSIC